ncbi:uncharacterized protein BJX67DRAFT_380218 [Aspergillus lucknowensis]|uniref:Uncharacterized protein n=1 Tax=Aspergillus lucknowensis TaxID=176173 RepID=A0ABR4LVA7_9EURO
MEATPGAFLCLRREVERLVTAPYAPSLQTLYTLTRRVSPTLIDFWVSQKPCQVGALAEVLVDALSRSRLACPLLASFARAPEFRNSLLQQHPYLLDQFLQQSDREKEDECLPVCISLLSSPFPCGLVLPASLAPFVMKVIGKIQESPSAENLRNLYLISGCFQATGMTLELPQEVMSCLQTELTKTLRNLEDHMGNILCLATFARLASSRSAPNEAQSEVEAQPWWQNINNFFGPKRGSKTLDLVVLRVILACSSSCGGLTAEQSAESIRLAIEICNCVDTAQRHCWIEGNSLKIAKLTEKITRDGINGSVKMLAVSFLLSLLPPAALSPDLARITLEWLVSENAESVSEVFSSHAIPRLVEANLACSQQFTFDKLLDYVCSSLRSHSSGSVPVAKLQLAKLLLDCLRSLDLQSLPATLVNPTSEQYQDIVHSIIDSFPREPNPLRCGEAAECHHAASKIGNDLLFDLLIFWIQMMLRKNMEQKAAHLFETTLFLQLIAKSKHLLPPTKCAFSDTRPADLRDCFPSLELREPTNTSRSDWRTGMREIMAANSRFSNGNIMRGVEDVCYELEQRCSNIEAPLRVAEEERKKSSLESERLKEQNGHLEDRLQIALNTISGLQEETSRLEDHAKSATSRAEKFSMALAESRSELDDLRRTSQEALTSERETFRTRELDMIACLTQRDDRLEELQERLKSQTAENARLELALASVSGEKDSSLESVATLKDEVSVLRTKLEKNGFLLGQKDETIECLRTERQDADKQIKDLQKKLSEETSKCESLRTALQDTTEKLRAEVEELRSKSELECLKMSEEVMEQKSKIVSLRRVVHDTASNAAKELQTKRNHIQQLEEKVQHLREERAAKALEFSEAQQHITRLMGVMGFKPASSGRQMSSNYRIQPSSETSQLATMQTRIDTGGGVPQTREEGPPSTAVGPSTTRPGPRGPKRTRNKAFPSAHPSSPRSQACSKKSKESARRGDSKPRNGRRPLEETDSNSHSNPQSCEQSLHSYSDSFRDSQCNNPQDQNHLEDLELELDLEFSKDFLFTSTALTELDGHGHV